MSFFKSPLNVLQHCFCSMFWLLGPKACGVLALPPGVKLVPPALVTSQPLDCQGSPTFSISIPASLFSFAVVAFYNTSCSLNWGKTIKYKPCILLPESLQFNGLLKLVPCFSHCFLIHGNNHTLQTARQKCKGQHGPYCMRRASRNHLLCVLKPFNRRTTSYFIQSHFLLCFKELQLFGGPHFTHTAPNSALTL